VSDGRSKRHPSNQARPRGFEPLTLAKAAEAVLVSSDRDVLEADIGDVEVLSAREFRVQVEPLARQPSDPTP